MPKEFIAEVVGFSGDGDYEMPRMEIEPNPAGFAFDKVQLGSTVRVVVVEPECEPDEAEQ